MLQQFVKAENNTVHTALGMVPTAVTGKHVLEIWIRMNDRRSCVVWEELNSMWDSMLESVKNAIRKVVGTQLFWRDI